MIIFFGPPGAGKSVQGQLLAAHHGWRWLSSGQLLRDSKNVVALKEMQTGKLVSNEHINNVVRGALNRAGGIERVVLDGYPRELEQAKWLLETASDHSRKVELAIVLNVSTGELAKRLQIRGRADDTKEAIEKRMTVYREETQPVLDYLVGQKVKVVHVDGNGTISEVRDRIEAELKKFQ